MGQTDGRGPRQQRAHAPAWVVGALPRNWSLRGKLAALVVAASLIPLGISTWLGIQEKEKSLFQDVEQILAARTDQMAREFDGIHRGYFNAAVRLATFPATSESCSPRPLGAPLQEHLLGIFRTFPLSDSDIGGVALIDPSGRVAVATEPGLAGIDYSKRPGVARALAGQPVISGLSVSPAGTAGLPTVRYLMPVRGPDGSRCVLALLVRANAFLRQLRADNDKAGPGSYSVIFDADGVRIAHSLEPRALYHPAAPLPAAVIDRLSAERRFGPNTRELLESVVPFPEEAVLATAARPSLSMFKGVSGLDGKTYFGVGRRLGHAGWTVFYLTPETNLSGRLRAAVRDSVAPALVLVALALLAALAYAANLVRTLRRLGEAARTISEGEEHAPVRVRGNDDLALLARQFNSMAERLREQSAALLQANEQLEARVRERTGLLNAIVDNSPAVVYAKDLEGRYKLVNNQFCELFGIARQDIVGRTDHEILDRATADTFRAMDIRVAETGRTLVQEEKAPSGGRVRTHLSIKSPLRDEHGRIDGVVGVSTDITDRTDAEAKLRAQLERLRLLDQISTAIGAREDLRSIYGEVVRSIEARMPADYCVIGRYDKAGDRLFLLQTGPQGREFSEALGFDGDTSIPIGGNGLRRCIQGELVYEPDLSASTQPMALRLAANGLRSGVLAPLQTEGRVFGVLLAARREVNAFSSGDCEFLRQLSGHVALAAQQARLTEALRIAYDDLRQSQQSMLQQERLSALGQMASGIAHDINNAVTPAALYAESLLERESGLSASGRQQLQVIARAIDDVSATVARMREFYRNREAPAERTPVDLNTVVQQVVDLTRARWSDMPQQRGIAIELRLELADGLPPVSGSEHELREALINLVFNAVDAMPSGGQLVVRTKGGDRTACAEVQDDGVGMDEETRRRCLEPFFTTKGERGTGLGLAMVYGVAQRHDADIEIDSAPGRGTCVRLVLPLAEPGQEGHKPATLLPLSGRLLLIDDDPVLLSSLCETLMNDGHTVETAQGGKAGLEAFRAAFEAGEPFDVVFTDLGMPGMDGRQVASALKSISPHTPVAMLTGWGQPLGDSAATPPDVDRVISKPPRLRELRTALLELVPKLRP